MKIFGESLVTRVAMQLAGSVVGTALGLQESESMRREALKQAELQADYNKRMAETQRSIYEARTADIPRETTVVGAGGDQA